jgi:hypothetical protein
MTKKEFEEKVELEVQARINDRIVHAINTVRSGFERHYREDRDPYYMDHRARISGIGSSSSFAVNGRSMSPHFNPDGPNTEFLYIAGMLLQAVAERSKKDQDTAHSEYHARETELKNSLKLKLTQQASGRLPLTKINIIVSEMMTLFRRQVETRRRFDTLQFDPERWFAEIRKTIPSIRDEERRRVEKERLEIHSRMWAGLREQRESDMAVLERYGAASMPHSMFLRSGPRYQQYDATPQMAPTDPTNRAIDPGPDASPTRESQIRDALEAHIAYAQGIPSMVVHDEAHGSFISGVNPTLVTWNWGDEDLPVSVAEFGRSAGIIATCNPSPDELEGLEQCSAFTAPPDASQMTLQVSLDLVPNPPEESDLPLPSNPGDDDKEFDELFGIF